MFFFLLVLTIASPFGFLAYKKLLFTQLKNHPKDTTGASETYLTQNPVELAYLGHGLKVAYGVTLYSLCAYKYTKRTRTGGILKFISREEKENPAVPYSNKMMKTVSSKMNSILIYNLGRNKSLENLFQKMILPFEERMREHDLMLNEKHVDNLRFVRFLAVTFIFVFGFYTLLHSIGFWTFVLAIISVVTSLVIMKKTGSYQPLTAEGEKYLNRCFQAVGRDKYKSGIYALSKEGRSRFNELDMNDFLGIKTISMDDFMD